MSQGTLYYLAGSPRSNWFPAYIDELGLDVKTVLAKESSAFATQFPLGKTPAFVGKDIVLNETLAICQYLAELAESPLAGRNALERAQITRWAAFINGDTAQLMVALWLQKKSEDEHQVDKAKLAAHLAYLNEYLGQTKFVSGGSLSWADIYCTHVVKSVCCLLMSPLLTSTRGLRT